HRPQWPDHTAAAAGALATGRPPDQPCQPRLIAALASAGYPSRRPSGDHPGRLDHSARGRSGMAQPGAPSDRSAQPVGLPCAELLATGARLRAAIPGPPELVEQRTGAGPARHRRRHLAGAVRSRAVAEPAGLAGTGWRTPAATTRLR